MSNKAAIAVARAAFMAAWQEILLWEGASGEMQETLHSIDRNFSTLEKQNNAYTERTTKNKGRV